MPRFQLMMGGHVQANPDGLDRMKLADVIALADKQGVDYDKSEPRPHDLKSKIIKALRGVDEDGEPLSGEYVNYQATATHKPVFEENNKFAVNILMQDPGKFRCMDGDRDVWQELGPITEAEIKRRGVVDNPEWIPGATRSAKQSVGINSNDSAAFPEGDSRLPANEELPPGHRNLDEAKPAMSADLNAKLVTMSQRQLQDFAAAEEIELTDAAGEPLKSKSSMVAAIRAVMEAKQIVGAH